VVNVQPPSRGAARESAVTPTADTVSGVVKQVAAYIPITEEMAEQAKLWAEIHETYMAAWCNHYDTKQREQHEAFDAAVERWKSEG
jgi:hypothetical protein